MVIQEIDQFLYFISVHIIILILNVLYMDDNNKLLSIIQVLTIIVVTFFNLFIQFNRYVTLNELPQIFIISVILQYILGLSLYIII